MIIASSGWFKDYHYVMVRDDATYEVALSVKLPQGTTLERRTSSFEIATQFISKLGSERKIDET